MRGRKGREKGGQGGEREEEGICIRSLRIPHRFMPMYTECANKKQSLRKKCCNLATVVRI